jgi:hypothetical protein
MVTVQPSYKTSTFVMSERRFLGRSLSQEEPDLDPGPSGRDRGNLQKGGKRKTRETASG